MQWMIWIQKSIGSAMNPGYAKAAVNLNTGAG
jgi:hypothetical protein